MPYIILTGVLIMKPMGTLRQIDGVGRTVIPAGIRKALDLSAGSLVEFYMEGDSIIVKKFPPTCNFCNSNEDLIFFKDHMISKSCVEQLEK